MSQQNFVEQFRLFMEYARKNSMHSRECMLWVSLFYLANEEATYNADTQTYEWPDDFFEISNGELNSYGKFDKQAVESLRNRLKQRGLIDFIKGNRNSATPMYKIHYFIRSGNKIIPNNMPNNNANSNANHIPNNMPNNNANGYANHVPNNTPLRLNINNTIPGYPEIDYYEDEEEQEEEQQRERAQAQARNEALAAWRNFYGETPSPFVLDELAKRSVMLRFQPGVLTAAIRAAAWAQAKSPMSFICTTMVDWANHHVETEDDADEYAVLRDTENGKFGMGMSMGASQKIKEFSEDRETPNQRRMRLDDERRREEYNEKRRAMIRENQAARPSEEA